jgi:predicted ATPase
MLKLKIKSLGNIKNATLVIKDLTVFVGKNNTNKSWTAYSIHALCSDYFMSRYSIDLIFYRRKNLKIRKEIFQEYLKRAEVHAKKLQNRNEFFKKEDISFFKELLKDYAKFVSLRFHDFLSVERETLGNCQFSLQFNFLENRKLLDAVNDNFLSFLEQNKFKVMSLFGMESFVKFLVKAIMKYLLGNPFGLPAERNTLITFSNLITLGEANIDIYSNLVNKMEELVKKLEDISERKQRNQDILDSIRFLVTNLKILHENYSYRYPRPVVEFKDFSQRLPSLRYMDGDINRKLIELFQTIIDGYLKVEDGTITYNFYKQKEELSVPIMLSSSMVKSLSGLHAYLKYRAKKSDLLIVDEPEMNLHPEAQAKLIEFIAIMVNKGIKVLLTTHSPYIVDHLVNLIEAKNSKKKDVKDLFFLRREDAFLDREKVSVYMFTEDGKVKDIFDKKSGLIDWETFSSISDRISQIYYQL